jgi:CubicO group peptidase (beta-lactamase class C family)
MHRIALPIAAAALSISTVCCGSLQAQSVDSRSPADSLITAVVQALKAHGLVGITWALVLPESTALGAAGLRDREQQRAMTPQTRMQVGSVTKTLIATGVLRLVTLGRIALDAPIRQYLPDLPLENPWEQQQPVLVRHLLDHTSGLDDAHLWQVFTLRADPDAPLASGLVRHGERLTIRYRPGARFSYSNSGFLTLAMLIERVTGVRYEQWLDQELLVPLGMTHSTFGFVSQRGPRADTAMAVGYFDGVTPQTSYAIPVRPAAQFATTAQDFALFARFLMSNGMVNGRALIDSTLLRAMAMPSTTEAAAAGLRSGYALGLLRRERWGITGNCHLGNIGTFRAIFCLYPEHQRAFFASYNTDPEGANFDAVDSLLASSLGVPQTPLAEVTRTTVTPAEWNGWYVVRPNRFAQFAYLDEVTAVTRVQWDGAALWLRPFQGSARQLQPLGAALFRQSARRSATHVVTRAPDGTPIISDGMRTLERVSRTRVVLYIASAVGGLIALLFLVFAGGYRTLRAWGAGTVRAEPLVWSVAAIAVLLLAPLLFLTQPALAMGDPTPANRALFMTSALLPIGLGASLFHRLRAGLRDRRAKVDAIALVSALQWCAVLAAWGLLPLSLWR